MMLHLKCKAHFLLGDSSSELERVPSPVISFLFFIIICITLRTKQAVTRALLIFFAQQQTFQRQSSYLFSKLTVCVLCIAYISFHLFYLCCPPSHRLFKLDLLLLWDLCVSVAVVLALSQMIENGSERRKRPCFDFIPFLFVGKALIHASLGADRIFCSTALLFYTQILYFFVEESSSS